MTTEDYVSVETAKLLQAKGFDGECKRMFRVLKNFEPKVYDIPEWITNEDLYNLYQNCEFGTVPTLQMAMKWLRKVHHWHIFVVPKWEDVEYMPGEWEEKMVGYQYVIAPVGDTNIKKEYPAITALTPESACEAAIKYCVENLI